MDMKRIISHLAMTPWRLNRTFPSASLTAIERAIAASETRHGAQLCFAVEGALPTGPLFRGVSARERAIEVFSRLRVWDTENNSGVLIYLLLADRDVEIVADRGVHAKVGTEQWGRICRRMEAEFWTGKYEAAVLAGIEAVTQLLATHYPLVAQGQDELSDRPVVL